jgi:membrane protein YqaA with SNARE-associated domain
VIDSMGALGVGLLVSLENIIPPIPSEVVLAMASYLAGAGRINVVLVVLAATAGSVLGALALYWLGATVSEDRLKRWLDHIPLVEREDLEKADRWFDRYGTWAVLLGRIVPVVRSLVSVPAGADRMPIGQFLALTTARQRGVELDLRRAGLHPRLAMEPGRQVQQPARLRHPGHPAGHDRQLGGQAGPQAPEERFRTR